MDLIDVYEIGLQFSQGLFHVGTHERDVLQRVALGSLASDDDVSPISHAIESIADSFLGIEIHTSGIDEVPSRIQIGFDNRCGLLFTDRSIAYATNGPCSQSQLGNFDSCFDKGPRFNDRLQSLIRFRLLHHLHKERSHALDPDLVASGAKMQLIRHDGVGNRTVCLSELRTEIQKSNTAAVVEFGHVGVDGPNLIHTHLPRIGHAASHGARAAGKYCQ